MLVVVALATVSLFITAITWQGLAGRRAIERRGHQLQAIWLARAGVELACSRLLREPSGYTGESLEILPQSQVKITVKPAPGSSSSFDIQVVARYPVDERDQVVRSLSRRVKRVAAKGDARLEFEPEKQAPAQGS
jgi:hypothetical protein